MKQQTRLPSRMIKAMENLAKQKDILKNYEKQVFTSIQSSQNQLNAVTAKSLLAKAIKNTPKTQYFTIQHGIDEHTRSEIIQWYQNTVQSKRLHHDVAIHAVQLFDLYLSKVPNAMNMSVYNISKYQPIYTLAGMCLSLAQKMVQQVPNLFMMFLPTFQASKQILIKAELEIIKTFKFNVNLLTYVEVINYLTGELFQQKISDINAQNIGIKTQNTTPVQQDYSSNAKNKKITPHNSSFMSNSNLTLNNSSLYSNKNDQRETSTQKQGNNKVSIEQRTNDIKNKQYKSLEEFKTETVHQTFNLIQKQACYITTNHFDMGVIGLIITLQRHRREDKISQLRFLLARELPKYDFKICNDIANTVIYNVSNESYDDWKISRTRVFFATEDGWLV